MLKTIHFQLIHTFKQNYSQMKLFDAIDSSRKYIGYYAACEPEYVKINDIIHFLTEIVAELQLLSTPYQIKENIEYFAKCMDRERELIEKENYQIERPWWTDRKVWLLEAFRLANTFMMVKVEDIPGFQEYLDSIKDGNG